MMSFCEWNPELSRAAEAGEHEVEATVCVGANGEWHLCASCAELPIFGRFKKRTQLRSPESTQEPRS